MKTKPIASRFPRHQSGMALISVLAVLFLLMLLVVAFMARTTGARASAASYRANASTRALSDTVVNLVQAQIREATTLGLVGGAATYTWGSQPGAIRVFDGSGNLNSIYRLYSAIPSSTNDTGGGRVATGADPVAALAADLPTTASNWTQYGAQWCDLNAFVRDSRGRYHFPIIDPRDPGADATAIPTSLSSSLWQPSSGATPLAGFSINTPTAVGNTTNPAPMPVRWLYILKDGSMISPDISPSPTNVLTFQNAVNATGGANVPTLKNPIVGRVAFWTDDDSSKININTAGGDDVLRPAPANNLGFTNNRQWPAQGTFSATPMFCDDDDALLAEYEPATQEFQRYTGHPATVGLTGTLTSLLGLSSPLPYDDFYGSVNPDGTIKALGLTPRYIGGGTKSATVQTPRDGTAGVPIPLTAQRLYTSVGEMLFNSTVSGSPSTRDKSVLINDSTARQEAGAAAAVERANFFLTAHSASSELNLFGEPRVSMWPIIDQTTARTWSYGSTNYTASVILSTTSEDVLLKFDSTIAHTGSPTGPPDAFYFQRRDPTSTITDCNIPNNIALFKYLDGLTSSKIPGFGNAFTTNKYPNGSGSTPQGMHQILAEIFDYIRTINVLDPIELYRSPNNAPSYSYGQNWGDPRASVLIRGYATSNSTSGGNNNTYRAGVGGVQVVPSSNNGNGVNGWRCQGIAAFPIPVEITIDFVAMGTGQVLAQDGTLAKAANAVPNVQYKHPYVASDSVGPYDVITDQKNADGSTMTNPGGAPADSSTAIQAFVYTSFVNPGLIASVMQPAFAYSMTGLNAIYVKTPTPAITIPLHFPGNVPNNGTTKVGPTTDEQCLNVDESTGAGFINGQMGFWMFGYIPFYGETGNGMANGGYLSPNPALNATWTVSYNNISSTGGISGTGRPFPFYSQLFGLPGQQGWPTKSITTASPAVPNPNQDPSNGTTNIFTFAGSGIQLTMYDAHQDNQVIAKTDKVATYNFDFPSTTSPLPIYDNSLDTSVVPPMPYDVHVMGTVAADGGWTNRFGGANMVNGVNGQHRFYQVYLNNNGHDVTKSIVLSPTWSDVRDLAMYSVPDGANSPLQPHPLYSALGNTQAQNQWNQVNGAYLGNSAFVSLGSNDYVDSLYWGRLIKTAVYSVRYSGSYQGGAAIVPPVLNGPSGLGAFTSTGAPGDWDNGISVYPDGPWINMADEGCQTFARDSNYESYGTGTLPYFNHANGADQKTSSATTFSPNRQVPSPALIGSLPTGINGAFPTPSNGYGPWQTLLFRPGSGAGGTGSFHWGEKDRPQAGDPPDHLLLDLFWMPVAEPYPISQPFVTEGKINLNYEIQPFTYITRDTALRALFSSEMIAMMPDSKASIYKDGQNIHNTNLQLAHTRLAIDADQTLGLNPNTGSDPHLPTSGSATTDTAQTDNGAGSAPAWYNASTGRTRFFRSASEICEMFLVPSGYNWSQFTNAGSGKGWYSIPGDFALVGDNTREKPYSDLYSRLTTKSNTYTVYYTVQALNNAEPQSDAGQQMWDESRGAIVGELRGSTTIERYLDPNAAYPDFLGSPTTQTSLEPYYKWRVIETRQFAP